MELFVAGLVVLTGLATIGYAAYLAKLDKTPGAVAISLAGLALVVLGGPAANRINKFAISEKGIEVAYNVVDATVSTEQEERTIASISAAIGGPEGSVQNGAANQGQVSTAKAYYNYILSLGYIPADLVGSGGIGPGAVIVYQKGLPVLWATQKQAFPKLVIETTPSGLGAFMLTSKGVTGDTTLEVRCEKGTKELTSLASLRTEGVQLYTRLDDTQDYYVVTESIACESLSILDISKGGTVTNDANSDRVFEYKFEGHVIVAYRLAKIEIPAADEIGA